MGVPLIDIYKAESSNFMKHYEVDRFMSADVIFWAHDAIELVLTSVNPIWECCCSIALSCWIHL